MKQKQLEGELNEGKTQVPTALFGSLVDIVADGKGNPSFLMIDEGKPLIARSAEEVGAFEISTPPPIKMIPWLLCRGENVLSYVSESDSELWDDITSYLRNVSELPSYGYYDLLTAWVFHSWIFNESKYSPYIWFFGIWERGKTRTGEGLLHICWRGILVESLRDAYLVRMANHFGCTFFFDVEELWAKAERHVTTDILLKRFEQGVQVPRVLWPDKGAFKDMVFFKIYGPTIVATNVEVPEVLRSRAIQIRMPESSRKFNKDLNPSDGLHLKERLCAFRLRQMMNQTRIPEFSKVGPGRLADIFHPLLQMTKLIRPEKERTVIDVMTLVAEERKSARADSPEGRIVECLINLKGKVSNGLLNNQEIMNEHERVFPGFQIKSESIGKILRTLGFKGGKRTAISRSIIYDERLLSALRKRMGL
jgi:hypothetical protein